MTTTSNTRAITATPEYVARSLHTLARQDRTPEEIEKTVAAILGYVNQAAVSQHLLAALVEIEAHHAEKNTMIGRPHENSKTLTIARAAIALAEQNERAPQGTD